MRFLILTVGICLGVFMQVLDSSIANVALPHIAGNLGVSVSESTWIITSFAAAQAIVLSLTGWLAMRFDEHLIFAWATALFGVASLMCGISPSLGTLTLSRVTQGAVSGVLIPLSQSLLLQLWPEKRRSTALGIWIMIALIGPVLGPLAGGYITDYYSWRWIFLVNIPIAFFCAISIFALWNTPGEPKKQLKLDWLGLSLLITFVATLQICLDRGQEWDWWHNNTLRALGIISVIALTYLLLWLRQAPNPIIDLKILQTKTIITGTLFGVVGTFIFFAPLTIFPIWLQQQLGYTPFAAGKILATTGLLTIVLTPLAAWMTRRWGALPVIGLGFFITGIVFQWGSHFTAQTSSTIFILNRLASGAGIAFLFIPSVELVLTGLQGPRVAAVSGFFSFSRYLLGLSCGTALMVTLYDRRGIYHRERIVEQLVPTRGAVADAINVMGDVVSDPETQWALLERGSQVQAGTLAINDIFMICALLAYLMLAICLSALLHNLYCRLKLMTGCQQTL